MRIRNESDDRPWPVLRSLTVEQESELMRNAVQTDWERGDDLVVAGDSADRFFLVDRGQLSVTVSNRRGESVMLAVLTRGDSFGELALIDETATRSATVTALSDARTLSISRPDFLALRARRPDVDRAVDAIFASHVRRLSGQVLDSRLLDAETKVRRRLAALAGAFGGIGPGQDAGAVVPLSQGEIAQLAGVGRQATNAVLKALEREGTIRLGRRSVEVVDAAALADGHDAI